MKLATLLTLFLIIINIIFPQRSEGATLGRPKGRLFGGPAYYHFNKKSPYWPPAFSGYSQVTLGTPGGVDDTRPNRS